jgi:hypothetical protein
MLSALARGHFASSPLLLLPVVALGLFVLVFAIACWRTFRAAARPEHERAAALPLEADRG